MNKWSELALLVATCFLMALFLSFVYKSCGIDPSTTPPSLP